jgi:hypothetical protein
MIVGLSLSLPCFLASSVALASSSSCLLTYIDVNEFRCVQKFGDRWGLVTRTATRSTRTTLIVACIFGSAAPACIRETHHLVYIDRTACFIYIYIFVCLGYGNIGSIHWALLAATPAVLLFLPCISSFTHRSRRCRARPEMERT